MCFTEEFLMDKIEKIKKIIADQIGVSTDEIVPGKELVKDLGVDSLDAVEIIMTMEDEFGVSIGEEEGSAIKTVDDVIELVNSKTV